MAMAQTPEPPYYAVIFASQRCLREADGYAEAAERMFELAKVQPGYLGIDTARGDDGFGITVSYWKDEASIAAWRSHVEHIEVQNLGRDRWYDGFELRIARVERASGFRR